MSTIQSGSNWWMFSQAVFGADSFNASLGGRFTSQAPLTATVADDYNETSDSLSSAVSDSEEEGEVAPAHEEIEAHASTSKQVADQIESDGGEMGVSEEIVAAAAMQIGVIEAAMRQHHATGVINLDDEDASSDDDKTEDAKNGSFLGSLLQDPNAAFAATSDGLNRHNLLALLKN